MVDNLDLGSEQLIVVAEGILFCLLDKARDRRVQFGWYFLWFVSIWCTWFAARIDWNLSRFTFFLNFVFIAIFNSVSILGHWKWIDIFIAWSSHDVVSWQVMVPLFVSSVSRSSFTLTLYDQISLLSLAFRFHARSLWLRVWKYQLLVLYYFWVLRLSILLALKISFNCFAWQFFLNFAYI